MHMRRSPTAPPPAPRAAAASGMVASWQPVSRIWQHRAPLRHFQCPGALQSAESGRPVGSLVANSRLARMQASAHSQVFGARLPAASARVSVRAGRAQVRRAFGPVRPRGLQRLGRLQGLPHARRAPTNQCVTRSGCCAMPAARRRRSRPPPACPSGHGLARQLTHPSCQPMPAPNLQAALVRLLRTVHTPALPTPAPPSARHRTRGGDAGAGPRRLGADRQHQGRRARLPGPPPGQEAAGPGPRRDHPERRRPGGCWQRRGRGPGGLRTRAPSGRHVGGTSCRRAGGRARRGGRCQGRWMPSAAPHTTADPPACAVQEKLAKKAPFSQYGSLAGAQVVWGSPTDPAAFPAGPFDIVVRLGVRACGQCIVQGLLLAPGRPAAPPRRSALQQRRGRRARLAAAPRVPAVLRRAPRPLCRASPIHYTCLCYAVR